MKFCSPTVSLSRGISFSAGRRLFCPNWDEPQNQRAFGLASKPHGHEYVLEVAYCGHVSTEDGMIMNLVDLKPLVKAAISPLDQSWIEQDVAEFHAVRPTAENIARYLWSRLPEHFGAAQLYRLRLRESRQTLVELSSHSMKISRSYEFAAAHRLFVPTLSEAENLARFDKCSNPAGHGHNYGLDVWVEGAPDPQTGFIISPQLLDALVETEVYQRFDHKHLNVDCPEFSDAGLVPTSENLARLIFELLGRKLSAEGYKLARIGLRETQKNYFEVEA